MKMFLVVDVPSEGVAIRKLREFFGTGDVVRSDRAFIGERLTDWKRIDELVPAEDLELDEQFLAQKGGPQSQADIFARAERLSDIDREYLAWHCQRHNIPIPPGADA